MKGALMLGAKSTPGRLRITKDLGAPGILEVSLYESCGHLCVYPPISEGGFVLSVPRTGTRASVRCLPGELRHSELRFVPLAAVAAPRGGAVQGFE